MSRERENLGELEFLILLAIADLGTGYGMMIAREIKKHTGRVITVGALYTVLMRLKRKGFVELRKGAPIPMRGGRAREWYSLTPAGKKIMKRTLKGILSLVSGGMRSDEVLKMLV